jgi:CRISPR-associated protein Cmr4
MYHKAYGIIETLAPVHVGATAGEETGNLNLIFRDQFTQTGIIPGSSIRGRFRADMRDKRQEWLESQLRNAGVTIPNPDVQEIEIQTNGTKKKVPRLEWLEQQAEQKKVKVPNDINENFWYGHYAVQGREDGGTTEALVKFEYASLVWLPVFCPGQPVVWVTCPLLLKRYKRIANIEADIPEPYSAMVGLEGRQIEGRGKILFFNLGFIEIEHPIKTEDKDSLSAWIPPGTDLNINKLVVVSDKDIAMLHDMALYRQSRVKLLDEMKKVDTERGAFFNTEALPEGSILVFPIALKQKGWKPFDKGEDSTELYFGGLESIGFGRCRVSIGGEYK